MTDKTAKLRAVIDAAKSVRDSLKEYDEDEHASGEIFYCEMMSESVDLLAEAIDEYEKSTVISKEDNVKRIRREMVDSMRSRKRVEDDSDLEEIVLKRMALDKQEMILMDWVDIKEQGNG